MRGNGETQNTSVTPLAFPCYLSGSVRHRADEGLSEDCSHLICKVGIILIIKR